MGKARMTLFDKITAWLLVAGGLNWLPLAFSDFNAVAKLAELIKFAGLSNIVYFLVGVSALWIGFRGFQGFK